MTISTVNRFILLLSNSFKALNVDVPIAKVESMAMLIQHSMDQGRRTYHTSSHVFEMCEGMNPRQALATLFHDVVYYQLDGGFPKQAHAMLTRSIRVEQQKLMVRAVDAKDTGLTICSGVFGFKAGDTLPLYAGMNEFLSALVAVRLLEPYLPTAELLAITACIEATIPFRGLSADGSGPFERLATRLRGVSGVLGVAVPEHVLARMLNDAIVMANKDVSGFAEPDPGEFLAVSWLLIEESNAPLSAVGIYSLADYRGALARMEGFLSSLNPGHIFHQYQGTPDTDTLAALCEDARANLQFATEYLGAKLVSIAIVEALALLTGGDCPVSMMLGDIRSSRGKPDRAEDYLPAVALSAPLNENLLQVLESGRARESRNDLTSSPLSAYVYRCLGRQGTVQAMGKAKQMFTGALTPRDFLVTFSRDMIRAMISACAQIALSRRDLLLALGKAI